MEEIILITADLSSFNADWIGAHWLVTRGYHVLIALANFQTIAH